MAFSEALRYLVGGITGVAVNVAVLTVGKAPAMGPIPNFAFVLGGSLLIGSGMNAFQRTTSMTIEDAVGTDAFRHQQYANPRPTTVGRASRPASSASSRARSCSCSACPSARSRPDPLPVG